MNSEVGHQLSLVVSWAGALFAVALEEDGLAEKEEVLVGQSSIDELLEPETPLSALLGHSGLGELDRRLALLLLAAALEQALLDRYRRKFGGGHKSEDALTIRELALLLGDDSLQSRLTVQDALATTGGLFRHGVISSAGVTATRVFEEPVRLTRAFMRLVLAADGLPRFHTYEKMGANRSALPSFAVTDEEHRTVMRDELEVLVDAAARTEQSAALMVLIWGPEGAGRGSVAKELAGQLFSGLVEVDGAAVALTDQGPQLLNDAFEETRLRKGALLIRGGDQLVATAGYAGLLRAQARVTETCIFLISRTARPHPSLQSRWDAVWHVPGVESGEQRQQLWEAHIPHTMRVAEEVSTAVLAERYHLDGVGVARAAALALAKTKRLGRGQLAMDVLDEAAERQLQSDFGGMVQRVTSSHQLRDLVLESHKKGVIRSILSAARSWHLVIGEWGLSERLSTGKCISCLFSGEPGTGKTFAAEIIAATLGEPLHIVSLPSIMSKWMGESERNLKLLFANARMSNATLLFDEADALFTQRVEVSTSQDSFRNLLTGLLLQELDRHTGVIILTTNLSQNIDAAFQRRIMFHIEFEQPDEEARRRIWEGMLPGSVPRADDVDLEAVAVDYELSGGGIKNAVLRSTLQAWEDEGVLTQQHLLDACDAEYRHAGRLIRGADGRRHERKE